MSARNDSTGATESGDKKRGHGAGLAAAVSIPKAAEATAAIETPAPNLATTRAAPGTANATMQRAFVASLRDPDSPPPDGLVRPAGLRPQRRFTIYRNNVYSSLSKSVAAKFPVIKRLLGEEYFAGVTRAFIDWAPPRTPVLIEFGADFPAFLESFASLAELPYVADVARLEWFQHEAYHAADAQPLALSVLEQIEPDSLPALRVDLHSSLRLLSSAYPVLAIWRANSGEAAAQPIRLDAGGDDLMVMRPELDVLLRRLRPGELIFVRQLLAAAPLGEAADQAALSEPAFDLQQALAMLLTSRIIIACQPGEMND